MVRQPSTAAIQARIRACATSPRHARAWAIEPIAAAMPAKCWAREEGSWVMKVNIIHQRWRRKGFWRIFLGSKEGLLFLKKKKQKDFIRLRCGAPGPP
jgi:hypothetical protein